MSMEGAVFVQTNATHNEVIAFSRAADGSLAPAGEFATGAIFSSRTSRATT